MLLPQVIALAALSLQSCAAAPAAQSGSALMDKLVAKYQAATVKHVNDQHGSCTANNLNRRREWSALNTTEKTDYIRAVKCLHTRPSIIGSGKAPGARSRYDDFQAAHIINTKLVHATALFFAWHRWFVYLYETALRDECGYKGYQPYWDWSKYAFTSPDKVPLYDGSNTSLSSNGKYLPNRNGTLQPFPIPNPTPEQAIYTAPGTGGGYIERGPLVDWIQNLGPWYNQTVKNGIKVPPNPSPDGKIALGYNPRHIIRDFNNTILQQLNTYDILNNFLVNLTTIHDFQTSFFVGPHLGGHSFISGVDNDLFTSPGDPLFWFHHAQVDRIYSIWQALDFSTREYSIDGTLTLLNDPPSRNATLNDTMAFEFSPSIKIRQGMSATANGLCVLYE